MKTFSWQPRCYLIQTDAPSALSLQGHKMYDTGVATKGITFSSNFVKIGQLCRQFKGTQTTR
jgi:hypothetical protein